ncbi:unnamed protein product, partial [Laminaria digitata]
PNTVPADWDSTGAMSVISSRSYNSRTEHVAPRLLFVSKLTKSGKIGLDRVPAGAMLIDI